MKRITLLISILCAALSVTDAAPSPTRRPTPPPKWTTGRIKGVVLDANDARVVGASLTIEGSPQASFKRRLKTGEAGEFELELPAGVYDIAVEAAGFRHFTGWELKVKPRETEMINIHLEVGPIVD